MEKKNQSIERTFLILESFKNFKNGASLSEVSDATGLHKSTVHRFLSTLISLGYVQKIDLKYNLTYNFYNLATAYLNESNLIDVSDADLTNLSKKVNEVVHLVIRDELYCVYINKIEANNAITMGSKIGARIPLLLSSVGKSMISFEDDEKIKAIYEKSIKANLIDGKKFPFEKLMTDINQTRKTGVGIDNEDNEPGIYCIGSAIKGSGEQILGAISITGPKQRMLEKIAANNMKKDVVDTAVSISKKMGG